MCGGDSSATTSSLTGQVPGFCSHRSSLGSCARSSRPWSSGVWVRLPTVKRNRSAGCCAARSLCDGRPRAEAVLPEYDFSRSRRNKCASRYIKGSITVTLDPDVAAVFPGAFRADQDARGFRRDDPGPARRRSDHQRSARLVLASCRGDSCPTGKLRDHRSGPSFGLSRSRLRVLLGSCVCSRALNASPRA